MAQSASRTTSGEKTDAVATAPAAAASTGRTVVLIATVALVGVAAGGAGGYFATRLHPGDPVSSSSKPDEAKPSKGNATAGKAGDAKPAARKASLTFVTPEMFTVNLADREHYLQIGVIYQVDGGQTVEAIKAHMPVIRSKILLLLSAKTMTDLSSAEGKAKLVEELVALAREVLPGTLPQDAVADVHFSAFVIQ